MKKILIILILILEFTIPSFSQSDSLYYSNSDVEDDEFFELVEEEISSDTIIKHGLLHLGIDLGGTVIYNSGDPVFAVRGGITIYSLHLTASFGVENYPLKSESINNEIYSNPHYCSIGAGYMIPIYKNDGRSYKVYIEPEVDILYKRYYYKHRINNDLVSNNFSREYSFGTNVVFMNTQKGKVYSGASIILNSKFSGINFIVGF